MYFSWPLGPCLRDLRPNWAAHGSGMWVTENSTAENKTCCCNDGGGNARTYWQEDMIQSPGLFFFFPPLLNKHQTAIRLVWQYHFLDFDNRWFPAASPPFTQKKKEKKRQIHNYHSKATKPCVLKTCKLQQILERASVCQSVCASSHVWVYIRQWRAPQSRDSLTFWYFRMWSNDINSCSTIA